MPPHRVVLATNNAGKIAEFRRILAEIHSDSIDLVGLEHFPELAAVEETGKTFLENARLKARAVCQQTGLPAIADDSGLCIDALGGSPGIFSARWSGVHGNDRANIEKVLAQLDLVGKQDRSARFICASVFVMPDGSEAAAEGTLEGHILTAPIGDFGFGYDPIFLPLGIGLSLAQLSALEKDEISHRGQSLRAIAPQVAAMLGTLG